MRIRTPTPQQIEAGARAMKTDPKHPTRRYTQAERVLAAVLPAIEARVQEVPRHPAGYVSKLSGDLEDDYVRRGDVLAALRGEDLP